MKPSTEKTSYVIALTSMLTQHGDSPYGSAQISEAEHAIQCAVLAREAGAPSSLVVASMFHDIGQIVLKVTVGVAALGVDNRHEEIGATFLMGYFPPEVTEPIRMHVPAKRFLFATDPDYRNKMSLPALRSMERQGGGYNDDECNEFRKRPFFAEAVQVRRWDDQAMHPGKYAGSAEEFHDHIAKAMRESVRQKLGL